jgi:Uma2 family endonuclease
LVLLTPERFHIDCNEYFDGGPDAVVEIHSPGDESYEKFPFYAAVGVREVLVIDRDTKEPELYELIGGEFQLNKPGSDGWIKSAATGIELRATTGDKLEVRILGRDDTRALLP